MEMIREPERLTPVIHECDICVIGGSTTGVFAAIAASRLGAKVAVVEGLGYFGGTATASMVCVWHTHKDEAFTKEIIAGITVETMERLVKRDAAIDRGPGPHYQYVFQPAELILELDAMVHEAGIRAFLHTRFVECLLSDYGRVDVIIIEDKSGRRAIRAKYFVDASGDADLIDRMGLETYRGAHLQPPTTTALIQGLASLREHQPDFDLKKVAFDKTLYPEALRPGFMWGAFVPGDDMYMLAGTRVHNADCSIAEQLTEAEFEGRRQVRNVMSILRKQPGGEKARLHALPARIGIRESRQVRCLHTLTQEEVLTGHRFPDAILNGSYRVDIHYADGDGILLRYLDGREVIARAGGIHEQGRWREPTAESPTFYQLPYRSLVPIGSRNVLIAGRCVDADEGAFGAVRVMVNTSQMGQAAGVAAYLALNGGLGIAEVDTDKLRATLSDQGAIVI